MNFRECLWFAGAQSARCDDIRRGRGFQAEQRAEGGRAEGVGRSGDTRAVGAMIWSRWWRRSTDSKDQQGRG